jgi:cell division protein FtsI/penicillin-binding protein 2
MEAEKSRKRLVFFASVLVLALMALTFRLVDLQWVQHEQFRARAESLREREFYREAQRGDIRDRRGNLLATSVPVKTVYADPALLKGREAEMAAALAPLLKTNEAALLPLLSRHWRNGPNGTVITNHYAVLKRKVPVDEWEKIQAALGQYFTNTVVGQKISLKKRQEQALFWMRSIGAEPDQLRVYPNQQLAAHVVGFTGFRTNVVNGELQNVTVGVEGIEATFDQKMRGSRGWVRTEFDGRKREIFAYREQDVQSSPGLNVVLTIDARVQQIVEEELPAIMSKHSAQSASVIVMRPKTGEILALANLPTFDPNRAGRYRDPGVRRNRIITDPFEPGSTFKTIVVAGAFNDGLVRLTDMFDCENGAFRFAGHVLHDHEHYGVISVQEIIAKSSNIGTAKVAIKMGQERAYRCIGEFGFGQRTGIPLTGEDPGYVPKLKDWKPIHISRIPIGQGVSATTLQMTMGMAAVANGGVLMRPMLVDSLVDEHNQVVAKYEPQPVRRVVSTRAAKTTVTALKTVVEKGTAEKAVLDHYTVAGKTGTAQKVVDGRYSHEKYFSSFIGFFPADDPELLITVCADEPLKRSGYYGGQVCAPVFKRIAERSANFLNIKPDRFPDETNRMSNLNRGTELPAMIQVRGKL